MATQNAHRSVSLTRTAAGRYVARNVRGGELRLGGEDTDFTPVELLLVALGGCSAIDVDVFTTRRSEPEGFTVDVEADKIRDDSGGNRLDNIAMTFTVTFPEGEAGDAARAILAESVATSHDRLCTVTRTVEHTSPVDVRIKP